MSTGKMVRIKMVRIAISPMPRTVLNAALSPRLDLALEFVNTLAYRGSTRSESLKSFSDLLAWCESSGALPKEARAELHRWSERHPENAGAVFRDAIELREMLARIFLRFTSETMPAESDMRALNLALAEAPARQHVAAEGESYAWRIAIHSITATAILAAVLWSAADLLVSATRKRIRHCANDQCLWLFVDDSKNGSRRWCSMQACGNRAKASRHYHRQKRS
jgi:predicted RNA-binding Zn ribbon-like protein